MKVLLTTLPTVFSTDLIVNFFVNAVKLKNIEELSLELDQVGLRKPSNTWVSFFKDNKTDGVICKFINNKFCFTIDFNKINTKYHFGKPITAIARIKLRSGEIITQQLPEVILVK